MEMALLAICMKLQFPATLFRDLEITWDNG